MSKAQYRKPSGWPVESFGITFWNLLVWCSRLVSKCRIILVGWARARTGGQHFIFRNRVQTRPKDFFLRRETPWSKCLIWVCYCRSHTQQQHQLICAVCTLAQGPFSKPENNANGLGDMQQKAFQRREFQVSLAAAYRAITWHTRKDLKELYITAGQKDEARHHSNRFDDAYST